MLNIIITVKNMAIYLDISITVHTFALTISRGGAVVARWAHNPKVVSSSLAPATKKERQVVDALFLCLSFWPYHF